jgi:hypothetical protein
MRRTLGRQHASRAQRADTAVAYPARFGWRSFIAYPFCGDVLANTRHGAAVDSPFEYRLAWLCRSSCPVPSHTVARIDPTQTIFIGQQQDGKWVDINRIVLVPGDDGAYRLLEPALASAGWAAVAPLVEST